MSGHSQAVDAEAAPDVLAATPPGESRWPPLAAVVIFMVLNIALRIWLPREGAIRVAWLLPAIEAALLIALLTGVLVSVVVIARKGVAGGRKTAIPFGPFLAFGGIVAMLVGTGLMDSYLSTF